jgi:hypothetical protein
MQTIGMGQAKDSMIARKSKATEMSRQHREASGPQSHSKLFYRCDHATRQFCRKTPIRGNIP